MHWTPSTRRTLLTGGVLLATLHGADLSACDRDRIALTCDVTRIQPASYGLVTRGAALADARQYDFWEQFDVDSPGRPLTSPHDAMVFAAQRAVELDVTNQMAYGIHARELLIVGQPVMAEEAWHRVIENQGSVVWPARLAGRDDFLIEFDRQGLRLYSRAEVEQAMQDASGQRVWAALAGCIDAHVRPAAVVPWLNVRAIQDQKKGALSFRLQEPIRIMIGQKTRTLDRLDVGLRGLGVAPACPSDTVRRLLARLVDPERRIALPSSN